MITTSLIQLNVACADHKNGAPLLPCKACEFLVKYRVSLSKIQKETDDLTKELEEFFKAGKVTAVDLNRRFLKGSL